jgi:hypothetical protein
VLHGFKAELAGQEPGVKTGQHRIHLGYSRVLHVAIDVCHGDIVGIAHTAVEILPPRLAEQIAARAKEATAIYMSFFIGAPIDKFPQRETAVFHGNSTTRWHIGIEPARRLQTRIFYRIDPRKSRPIGRRIEQDAPDNQRSGPAQHRETFFFRRLQPTPTFNT